MQKQHLEFVRSWVMPHEVFEIWRGIEENLPHWKEFWKAKGYKSWEDWRRDTHKAILRDDLENSLCWVLYRVKNPLQFFPECRGGLFHSWSKWFYPQIDCQGAETPKLKDLLAHPGVHNHWYIRAIAENFHTPTTITAIDLGPDTDIYIVEGMHRACALTMMAHNGAKPPENIDLILGSWTNSENLPRLGTGWKQ